MASEMIFEGDSANNGGALYVSNGTSGGTKRIKLKNQYSNGLVNVGNELGVIGPIVLTFDGLTYLLGYDAQNHYGLFIYDAATGASSELVGAIGANQSGLTPEDFVAYDGKVYFDGYGALLTYGLWVTDGTKAGTKSVNGANFAVPQAMTVYDGLLYISAVGGDGHQDLFTYNAKSGKTAELYEGLDPSAMKAFSVGASTGALTSELFVDGQYSMKVNGKNANVAALIVFNGSKGTAFTTEANYGGLAPTDLVGLDWSTTSGSAAVHNGAVFFSGVDDSAGHRGVFESDGKTVREVAPSTDAGSKGGLDPFDLTAFDGKLYFTGFDKFTPFSDGRGLFVYNPTTKTTTELIESTTLNLMDGYQESWGDRNAVTMGVFDGKLYFGAANPNAFGAASVPQLYQYLGGASAKEILVADASGSGLMPMSFGTT